MKLIKWLDKKGLLFKSWKDYALLALLLVLFKKNFFWVMIILIGIAIPQPIPIDSSFDYVSTLQEGGEKIGQAYSDAMIKLFENGLKIGELTDPFNTAIVWIIFGFVGLMLFSLISLSLISIFYKKKKALLLEEKE